MHSPTIEIQRLLEELYHAKTVLELNQCLAKICDFYMVERFALSALSNTQIIASEFDVLERYPAEWMKRYLERQYYLIDPVFHGSEQPNLFFTWHIEKFKDVTPQQKQMLLDADDFGIRFGTTLSLLPTQGSQYFMTLLDANIDNARVLYMIANAANYYLRERHKIESAQKINTLTKKQQEILELKRKGYPLKKIADILGKDLSTIHLHIYNIKEKLNLPSSDQVMYAYGFSEGLLKK